MKILGIALWAGLLFGLVVSTDGDEKSKDIRIIEIAKDLAKEGINKIGSEGSGNKQPIEMKKSEKVEIKNPDNTKNVYYISELTALNQDESNSKKTDQESSSAGSALHS